MCKQCDSDEVEDVCRMVECDVFDRVREPLLKLMKNIDDDSKQKTKELKTSTIFVHACCNCSGI